MTMSSIVKKIKTSAIILPILCGTVIGVFGVLITHLGNPAIGFCISCSMENMAGFLGLHGNIRMQYMRPEVAGFVLGAFILSLTSKEFKSKGGSAAIIYFISGIFLIIGAAVFIGCPIKLVFRLAAGDMTAIAGVFGLIGGILFGVAFLRNGHYFGESHPSGKLNGLVVPFFMVTLLALLFTKPSFVNISIKGSGASYAPPLIALAFGLIIGGLSQRSRFCVTGAVRNFVVARDFTLAWGLVFMFVSAMITSLALGMYQFGIHGQPSSNPDYTWSFLGMALVGFGSVIIGGCPYRQLIKAGEGNIDSAAAVFGMLIGGAIVVNWGLAAKAAGTPFNGKIAVLLGFVFFLVVGLASRVRAKDL